MKRAIILAAGLGTRLKPLTLFTPKPLLKVRGISLLENTINILKQSGISQIIVICGYKKECFYELRDKLKFDLLEFSEFDGKNSAASLKFGIDYLQKGSLVLNGDLYFTRSFMEFSKPNTTQFIAQKFENEPHWGYLCDSNFKINSIDINATSGFGDGVAFFDNEADLNIIKKNLLSLDDGQYWESCILKSLKKINIYAFCAPNFYYEIDSFSDALKNHLLTPEEIAIQCASNGKCERIFSVSNINYKINFLGESSIIRIKNNELKNCIDVNAEKEILKLISQTDISIKREFYGSDITMSAFLDDFAPLKINEISRSTLTMIMDKLQILHSFKYENHKNFKKILIYKEILKFEKLAKIQLLTQSERMIVIDLAKFLDLKDSVLCHRDLQLPNILFNGKQIKLIDFEYAGFCARGWEFGNMISELNLKQNDINFILQHANISRKEVIAGALISNYIWALWGWIYNQIDLGREYLFKMDSYLKEFKLAI